MSKRTVSTVLKELLARHGISAMTLHRSTGVPQPTLSRILSGKIADPSDRHISKIAEYFHISTDRLRGRDDVRVSEIDLCHPELRDICLWDDDTPVADDEVSIPFLRQVELAAGSGRFAIEESERAKLRFGKRSLRHNGVEFDHAKCVTVRGDSMLPVLRDGATVGSMRASARWTKSLMATCMRSIITASYGSNSCIAWRAAFVCAASTATSSRMRIMPTTIWRMNSWSFSVMSSGGACTPASHKILKILREPACSRTSLREQVRSRSSIGYAIKQTIPTVFAGPGRLVEIVRINICTGALTVYPYMHSLCSIAANDGSRAGV